MKGFTLLEVIIAITLMAFLSFFTAQSIQKAVEAKRKIQGQIDREMELREALNLMTRDLQMAFNYRDINIELHNRAIDDRKELDKKKKDDGSSEKKDDDDKGTDGDDKDPQQTNPTDANGDSSKASKYEKKEDVLLTHFVGEEGRIDFTSLSRVRTGKDERLSDQAEIGYYVESCKSRKKIGETRKCLWRRVSAYIDDKVTEGGNPSPLLEGVIKLQFRYIGPGAEEEWIRVWNSQKGEGQSFMEGNFPYAVEVTLEIDDQRFDPPRTIAMSSVAQLRFPNNPEKKEGEGAETAPESNP